MRVEKYWHAEVGDEGGLGQVHLKEDFPGGVCFVQSLGGHDCVGETSRHRALHGDTVHLHLRLKGRMSWKDRNSHENEWLAFRVQY